MGSRAGRVSNTLHSSKALVGTKQMGNRPHHLVLSPQRSSTATAVCSAPTSWPRQPRTMAGGSTGQQCSFLTVPTVMRTGVQVDAVSLMFPTAVWRMVPDCKEGCGCIAHAVVMYVHACTESELCWVHVLWCSKAAACLQMSKAKRRRAMSFLPVGG